MFLVFFLVPSALCVYVETPLGVLEGRTEKSLKQTQYYAFEGIRYAKPPIGELRFVAPVEASPWSGIYNATFQRSVCWQIDRLTHEIFGSEDCLHLNVYTPSLDTGKKLSVIVFVFGGGLENDSAKQCSNPELFMDADTIIISFNHRLTFFGFLTLDTPEVPGNAALRDIALVLKWVQKYIKYFGGDPNNVTVLSLSSGAVMVDVIRDSKLFNNLFHKTIYLSGNRIIRPVRLDRSRKTSKYILKSLHVDLIKNDTLQLLQKVPVDVFVKLIIQVKIQNQPYDYFVFDITNELNRGDGQAVNFDIEEEMAENCTAINTIPSIMGHTSQDFFNLHRLLEDNLMSSKDDFILPYEWNLDANKTRIVAQKVKQLYFKGHSYNKESPEEFNNLYTLLSHVRFMLPVYNRAREVAKCSEVPIYYYLFDFDGSSIFRHLYNIIGTVHGDEIQFIFPEEANRVDERSSDGWIRKRFIAVFTNFAKNGNPTPEISNLLPVTWKPFDIENENYLHFTGDLLPAVHPIHRVVEFWNSLKKQYFKKERREVIPLWAL